MTEADTLHWKTKQRYCQDPQYLLCASPGLRSTLWTRHFFLTLFAMTVKGWWCWSELRTMLDSYIDLFASIRTHKLQHHPTIPTLLRSYFWSLCCSDTPACLCIHLLTGCPSPCGTSWCSWSSSEHKIGETSPVLNRYTPSVIDGERCWGRDRII